MHINNYNTIAKIKIKFLRFVICSIYLRKTTIIISRAKMSIVVYYSNISKNRDFLFESKNNISLAFYVDIIDFFIKTIIARNNINKSMQISRNYRLDYIIEIDYSNVFLISANKNIRNFIVKESKTIYQNNWFKKLVFACAIVYVTTSTILFAIVHNNFQSDLRKAFIIFDSLLLYLLSKKSFANKTILFNKIIIYNLSFKYVDIFSQIVKNYSILWQDINFANFSKENWIRISLKLN